jgi:hypothetical protein
MAARCAKCEGESFAVAMFEPQGARHKMALVHCQGCGAPAGVADYRNVPALIDKLQQDLSTALARIGALEKTLTRG